MALKPYLAAALICEKILQEKDDVPSVVRVVDTFNVTVPSDLPSNTKPAIQITGFLAFKKASLSDEAERHHATIQVHAPSGQKGQPTRIDLLFKADPIAGATAVLNMNVGIEFGIFWIDVFVDDDEEPIARIPFRLLEAPRTLVH